MMKLGGNCLPEEEQDTWVFVFLFFFGDFRDLILVIKLNFVTACKVATNQEKKTLIRRSL